jgi:hypothetical protein
MGGGKIEHAICKASSCSSCLRGQISFLCMSSRISVAIERTLTGHALIHSIYGTAAHSGNRRARCCASGEFDLDSSASIRLAFGERGKLPGRGERPTATPNTAAPTPRLGTQPAPHPLSRFSRPDLGIAMQRRSCLISRENAAARMAASGVGSFDCASKPNSGQTGNESRHSGHMQFDAYFRRAARGRRMGVMAPWTERPPSAARR